MLRDDTRWPLRRLTAVTIAFALGCVVSEGVLQVVAKLSPAVAGVLFDRPIEPYVKDPILGNKGNPLFPEHDARGYRNRSTVGSADIIALGDSHTYGTSVSTEQAWPYLLQQRTGLQTYSMAHGGYGTTHSYIQLDEALSLKPRLVVLAVYFGNDFFDNFQMALRNPQIQSLLDPEDMTEIAALEERSPLWTTTASELFNMRDPVASGSWEREFGVGVRVFLSRNSGMYGLGRAIKRLIAENLWGGAGILADDFETARRSLQAGQLKYCSVFEGRTWKTILQSPYRGLANDTTDRRIAAGYALTFRLISMMQSRCQARDVHLLVVLLPTKESVFSKVVDAPDEHIGYAALLAQEKRNREGLSAALRAESIEYLDLLPALQASALQPYFANADGHPNPTGHRIIATKISEWINANLPQLNSRYRSEGRVGEWSPEVDGNDVTGLCEKAANPYPRRAWHVAGPSEAESTERWVTRKTPRIGSNAPNRVAPGWGGTSTKSIAITVG